MLQFGANPNGGKVPPLFQAIKNQQFNIVDLLLKYNANINIKFNDTYPIHLVTIHDYTNILPSFIKNGANINLKDSSGNTPLHYTVYRNNVVSSKLLLDAGAKMDIVSNRGKTSYEYANFYGLQNIVNEMRKYIF